MESFIYSVEIPPLVGGFSLHSVTMDVDSSFDWEKTVFFVEGDIPDFLISAKLAKSGRTIFQRCNISEVAGSGRLPFILPEKVSIEPMETVVFTVEGESVSVGGWVAGEAVVLTFGFEGSPKPVQPGEILDDEFFPHTIPNLTTLSGYDTGASFTTIDVYSGFNVLGGNPALSLPPYISNDGMSEGWFITDATVFTFEFTDLPEGAYTIIFAGSRDIDDNERNGEVSLLIGASGSPSVQVFNAANPVSGTEAPHVTFEDVEPVGGVIRLSCTGFGAFNRCYLNSLAIVKAGSQGVTTTLSMIGVKKYV